MVSTLFSILVVILVVVVLVWLIRAFLGGPRL